MQFAAGFGLCVAVLFALTWGSRSAMAFPDFVRHGYTTCLTCHMSPSGGGVLTPYGKFVGGELLGRFNDSSTALPWLVTPEENKLFTAMYMGRATQSYFDTPFLRRGDLVLMQSDIEGGLSNEKLFAFATVGFKLDSKTSTESRWTPFFRRFYAGAKAQNYAVRVGKFFPEFGINHPNHNIATRKGMFFNHNEEPLIAHASWYGSNVDLNASVFRGEANTELAERVGYTLNFLYRTPHTRSGMSFLSASKDSATTRAYSVHTQLGYLTEGYTLLEYGLKQKIAEGVTTNTQLVFLESGYEVTKGIIPYLGFQLNDNITARTRTMTLPAVGARLYPFTHSELIVEAGQTHFMTAGNDKGRGLTMFAMLNIYF